jgi:hypothetical protein
MWDVRRSWLPQRLRPKPHIPHPPERSEGPHPTSYIPYPPERSEGLPLCLARYSH